MHRAWLGWTVWRVGTRCSRPSPLLTRAARAVLPSWTVMTQVCLVRCRAHRAQQQLVCFGLPPCCPAVLRSRLHPSSPLPSLCEPGSPLPLLLRYADIAPPSLHARSNLISHCRASRWMTNSTTSPPLQRPPARPTPCLRVCTATRVHLCLLDHRLQRWPTGTIDSLAIRRTLAPSIPLVPALRHLGVVSTTREFHLSTSTCIVHPTQPFAGYYAFPRPPSSFRTFSS